MARGLNIEDISHVINFDTPDYPENYMHRIGRTGRAEKEGHAILFTTEKEQEHRQRIEALMQMKIELIALPSGVEISTVLIEEEKPVLKERHNPLRQKKGDITGPAFHEKKEKNKKVNHGGSYRREISKKYKKPKTRGDKHSNRRNKKRN
jgi:ATP-dependent RNA helicase RhlE